MSLKPKATKTKSSKPSKRTSDDDLRATYLKKTPLEHIKDRPDTYVGSIREQDQERWIYDTETSKIVPRNIAYVPALYKIADEIFVNVSDHQSDLTNKVKNIYIDVDEQSGEITVHNDGIGFPVKKHPDHKLYIPAMLMGTLLTGTNFNDDDKRIKGGRNGYGAKLTNIFSILFSVYTASGNKSYRRTWQNNMSEKSDELIEKCSAKEAKDIGTSISFIPDYEKFGIKGLTDDMVALLRKRTYDLAATTSKKVTVHWNREPIVMKNFEDYVNLYVGNKVDFPRVYKEFGERWNVCVVYVPDDEYRSVSFVNGIETYLGGEHVEYITNQIVRKLTATVRDKNKGIDIKPGYIKMKLWIFVNSIIENPTFDSQCKGALTLQSKDFGSICKIDDDFITKLSKTGISKAVEKFAEHQAGHKLAKTDGSKKSRVKIPKLDDANWAGGAKSGETLLILCEGDSAKTFCISGLSVLGRDKYGVFPLRGKLLNVRTATMKQRLENEEINHLKTILGLRVGHEYQDTDSLRYGGIVILTDADDDGSHIKGLVINWLHYSNPSLLKLPGFLKFFRTPIVKATKKNKSNAFYSLTEYNTWRDSNITTSWDIKYYKGLGTSTAKEAKGYFMNLEQHLVDFIWEDGETKENDDAITLGFSKERAADRKDWLRDFKEEKLEEVDAIAGVSHHHFVHNELIRFSAADNIRSLPGFDGLKPSQRKVLYCALDKIRNKQIKVAQFSGIVSADSSYHHGEASLQGVIIGMAQDFPGSGNNINFLQPLGQFGSRIMAGKDAASPRYIFTQLEKISEVIFNPLDNPLLDYLDDDGVSIEPRTYYPVIPMILVNGAEGIGTGYSTYIPPHNPEEVADNILRILDHGECDSMLPWFSGTSGTMTCEEDVITCTGIWERDSDTSIMITDLPPIGKERATQHYITFLDNVSLENSKDKAYTKHWVSNYQNYSTDYLVRIQIEFVNKSVLDQMIKSDDFEKKMKLKKNIRTSNMHVFNHDGSIVKYQNTVDILSDYVPIRLDMYDKRRVYMLEQLAHEIEVLQSKIRFLTDVGTQQIELVSRRRTKNEVESQMEDMQYLKVKDTFDYLLNMSISSFTDEKLNDLETKLNDKVEAHSQLAELTPVELWKNDLVTFKNVYQEMVAARTKILNEELELEADRNAGKSIQKSAKKVKRKKKKVRSN